MEKAQQPQPSQPVKTKEEKPVFDTEYWKKVMLENEPVNSSGHVDLAKKKSCGGRPKHVHNITIH